MSAPTNEEAFAALRAGGLRFDDPDLTQLFDTSAPDFVAKAKAAKPGLFFFDARVASPDAVEAQLAEIDRGLQRRHFNAHVEELLSELRDPSRGRSPGTTAPIAKKPAPSQPEPFDARTAPAAEVEARLAQLTGGH